MKTGIKDETVIALVEIAGNALSDWIDDEVDTLNRSYDLVRAGEYANNVDNARDLLGSLEADLARLQAGQSSQLSDRQWDDLRGFLGVF